MIHKLLDGIKKIDRMPIRSLRDTEYLATLIRGIGLQAIDHQVYGNEARYMNPGAGIYQLPMELARFLVLLSDYCPRTVLEIGTWVGWTTAVTTAYLRRRTPDLTVVSLDPTPFCTAALALSHLLPIRFETATSSKYRGRSFDLCLIDGEHSYRAVTADYMNVGQFARICAFHDINDRYVIAADPEGSVPRFWKELKSREPNARFTDILSSPPGLSVMGIGVRIRKDGKDFPFW